MISLTETNIAPQNMPSQKETNLSTIHYQVRFGIFREGKFHYVCLLGYQFQTLKDFVTKKNPE